MKLKDFFILNKSQRNGLFIVVLILVCFVVLWMIIPLFFRNSECSNVNIKELTKETELFKSHLRYNKYLYNKKQYPYFWNNYPDYYYDKSIIPQKLFVFNPNTLDSLGFIALGIKPFMIKNIIKYRNKGGRFKKSFDFSRIYGLSEAEFKKLEPYINIPQQQQCKIINSGTLIIVDLNTIDTLQLMQIKGIYGSMAKRIIGYGKKLGGYVSVEQLKEVWGMTDNMFQRIKNQFVVRRNIETLCRIPINKSGIDRLRSHPYINFYQAKALYEYRRNHHRLSSINDLYKIEDESITPQFISKIKPYLSFE